MIEFARRVRFVDFCQGIGIISFRQNSELEMAPSCCDQHVGKSEVLLLTVPRSRLCDEISCCGRLSDEPKNHEGV